jgi:hypothetical protein
MKFHTLFFLPFLAGELILRQEKKNKNHIKFLSTMSTSSNTNTSLKGLLLIQTLTLLIYTGYVIAQDGLGLFQIFTDNILSLNWNGQFNLDFSCYLLLSGLWIMWRKRFSTQSILIAIPVMIMGIVVFAPYLLLLLINEKGDVKKLLLGDRM